MNKKPTPSCRIVHVRAHFSEKTVFASLKSDTSSHLRNAKPTDRVKQSLINPYPNAPVIRPAKPCLDNAHTLTH